jgi:hypothetical protein
MTVQSNILTAERQAGPARIASTASLSFLLATIRPEDFFNWRLFALSDNLICAPMKYYWEIIADNLSKAEWSWAASQPWIRCRRTSFFGSVLFSYFPFCSFNCCSACRCSVCRLAMTKWLFSP